MASVLDGIRILDFSRVFAGPAATQILGDLGADVIKVEEPTIGDDARTYGVDADKLAAVGTSPPYLALNRNKRSIGIDLRQSAGRQLASHLARSVDVVVHNFRPGLMAGWGLDYTDLVDTNPTIIFCDFSAYGPTGPLSHVGANDIALQAFSGLMSITGTADGELVRAGTSVVDLHAGVAIACAIIAALFHRQRTGEGQRVESSLLLSSAHLMGYFYTEYWLDGTIRKPMGSANHLTVPNQAFPTIDGNAVIIASTDDMWLRCAQALDPSTLDIPEFRTADDRRRHRERLVAALSAVTSRMTSAELVRRLGGARIVVSKLNSIGEAADSAQLAASGTLTHFRYGDREIKSVGPPFTLEKTPAAVRYPPPRLGADTMTILHEFGIDDGEIDTYRKRGALGPDA